MSTFPLTPREPTDWWARYHYAEAGRDLVSLIHYRDALRRWLADLEDFKAAPIPDPARSDFLADIRDDASLASSTLAEIEARITYINSAH